MKFVEILNDLLIERGKTKVELSTEADIPYTTICGWLKAGRLPDYNALIKLSKYFGISTDYLLGIENEYGIKDNTKPMQQHYTPEEQQLIEVYRTLSSGKKKALFSMLDIDITQTKAKRKNGEDNAG